MICAVIKGPTFDEAHRQIEEVRSCADILEIRFDHFSEINDASVGLLRSTFPVPMIFTLRSSLHGGKYIHTEEKRLSEIEKLSVFDPEYLDLECHIPSSFIQKIKTERPGIKLILSYHDFVRTPEDLQAVYDQLTKNEAHFYKIAAHAEGLSDALRLLILADRQEKKVIPVSMGALGRPSRILGAVAGSPFTYAAVNETLCTAPGQLTAKSLSQTYHYRSLSRDTAVYGLIGNPIDQSIGAETHNHVMKMLGLDSVYVKMQITREELNEFFLLIKQLPVKGLSVTMPLKEAVLPYLDQIEPHAQAIGAVNTLLFEDGKIKGFNTDGYGAWEAIQSVEQPEGKKIIIIGAGGAARAIAYEACRRGGIVSIVNRNPKRSKDLARQFSCSGYGLDDMAVRVAEGYDILINCTPDEIPISSEYILPETVVMDINTRTSDTALVRHARAKGCTIIPGYRMFVEQALAQIAIWFDNKPNVDLVREIFERKTKECLFL